MPTTYSAEIEWRPLSSIFPYQHNNKKHPAAQIEKVAASINAFGMDQPFVVDADGVIIKGHARREACLKLGIDRVPVIVRADLAPNQVKAARIMDNRSAISDWDIDALVVDLSALRDDDFDLRLTGWDDDELSAFLAEPVPEGLTDPDDVPEPPAAPVSMPGDVWTMGRHRLACGDSTDADTVAKVLDGVSPHLMVTDPPYGVDYVPGWRSSLDKVKRSTGTVSNDGTADWTEAYALFPGDVAYVWHSGIFAGDVASSLKACGFALRSQIIWAKPHFVIGRGDYHWHHESCWYAVRKNGTGHWAGDRKQSTVWQIANGTFQGGKAGPEDAKTGHGTQKPVECMRRPIENNSSAGQAIYDPFGGSGTTLIAAEQTGRSCHMVELNPAYVDVIVTRWQNFSGKQAALEDDGRTFDQIRSDRTGTGPVPEETAA